MMEWNTSSINMWIMNDNCFIYQYYANNFKSIYIAIYINTSSTNTHYQFKCCTGFKPYSSIVITFIFVIFGLHLGIDNSFYVLLIAIYLYLDICRYNNVTYQLLNCDVCGKFGKGQLCKFVLLNIYIALKHQHCDISA